MSKLSRQWLEKVETPRFIDPFSSLLQPLREDPRWWPFWQQFGPAPEELAAIDFDPDLPTAE